MSYWEKRKEHDMYEAMKSAEETSQEIAEIYARASRELNYQISKIYERYRDKYDMTDEEALRLLNAMKDPADINELKMKLQGLEGEAAKEILKELESPAYRARIKRLENLQDEIDRKMKEVYKQEKKISTDHYIEQYQQSYYREIFDTKKMTGLDFSFSKVDPKRLDKVLHSNWSGANYSKRIWNNTEELAEDLKKEISLAYLTGKAERDIAHDIALKYATGASNARRLVRTESAYISGQAQAAADEECGIDKYRIVATLDLRTSKICQEMDGKEFAYKDMKVGENYPPFHPYCRTTVISVLDDQDLDVLTRRARDPETGKNKTVPANMTYQEWYAKEVEGNPKAKLAEQTEKNREGDLKQYEKYVNALGKKRVGSISEFREKKYNASEDYEMLKQDYSDIKQLARYKEVLGDLDELKNLEAFKDIKYNKAEQWTDMQGLVEYIKKYPNANKGLYLIKKEAKALGMKIGDPLPAQKKIAYILPDESNKRDSYHIMHRMKERGITDDELRSYVDNAKVMFVQWSGKRQLFITPEGAAVLHKRDDNTWIFKTAWKDVDYDENYTKLVEAIEKYG